MKEQGEVDEVMVQNQEVEDTEQNEISPDDNVETDALHIDLDVSEEQEDIVDNTIEE